MTTNNSESTTKPHWSDETADAAVQAAIEARALMLATARALGLADEDVEQAPQRAAELRDRLRVAKLASLCHACATVSSRHHHSGIYCRWCGRPRVIRKGAERLSYADLRARLIEIERHDV